MGKFIKQSLPDPQAYYEAEGLPLQPGGQAWRTTRCDFHGGSDSLRVHLPTGAFVCMAACGARGGDVLAHHMAAHGLGFVEAAKALGAWQEDDSNNNDGSSSNNSNSNSKSNRPRRPAQPPARALLAMVDVELTLCAIVITAVLRGEATQAHLTRLCQAAGHVIHIAELAHVQYAH